MQLNRVVDVAYLKNPVDTDETLEKSVALSRIRILLGGDDRIPDTLEEARIMAMGGEEIVEGEATQQSLEQQEQQKEFEEATGLSGWSTVQIKRTTVRQELKEERERKRQQRREAVREAEQQKKQAEIRKMEEAAVANAEDSALGAYDVWSRGDQDGYKGVNIHDEGTNKIDVHDTAKKLSEGKGPVGFKKTFKKKKGAQNRRKTSADDD